MTCSTTPPEPRTGSDWPTSTTYIDDADATNDPERAARARKEKDELVQALTAAYGIAGRPRRLGDANERARKTVTARIRDSIGRIAERHPGLGEHLGTAVTHRRPVLVRPRIGVTETAASRNSGITEQRRSPRPR
jgi:hypothetical protein